MLTNLIERAYAVPTGDQIGTAIIIDDTGGDINTLISRIVTWIVYIAGVLAFIYLVVAGITFITAGGNAEQAKKGQTGLIFAIIGIVVITLAYIILQAASNIGEGDAAVGRILGYIFA